MDRSRHTRHSRHRRHTRHPHCVRLLLPLGSAVCAAALLAGCSGSGPSRTDATTQAAAPERASASDLQRDYQKVIRDVLPSVVQINATDSLGSGVVYDDEGHVVTNAHVVGEEETFTVTSATGEDTLTAKLVFSYPQQDLAVIKLDEVPDGLRAAEFADSMEVEVGQLVLAMGSPLGLSSSVTQGIVSATGRTISEGRRGGGTGAVFGDMVQTSAPINPGNSGGALVDLDSEVIGIPTLAATDPELGGSAALGIGFAIPASTVRTIADQIVKDGRVTDSGRAALDITARTVVGDDYRPAGAAIVETTPDGAADEAGLRPGDVITRIGDAAITTTTSLAEALASAKPGDKVEVTYTRDDDERTTEVTLGER
ncbi:S1C family serine protease [Streptomyces apocyni]|uniref:S1C family serine protease n=1 Tax=Streptomyces apocyni TaxID=2654677 RepID=UPI0012EA4926|nr:trypsin-like peptidase domain-containing protein [Streptomyces apocyni]